jgi:hypothetical protein
MISWFRHDVNEVWDVLGLYETYSGNSVPTFRDNLSVPSSVVKQPKKTIEDTNDRLYRNFGKKLPLYAAQNSRRVQISQTKMYFVSKT